MAASCERRCGPSDTRRAVNRVALAVQDQERHRPRALRDKPENVPDVDRHRSPPADILPPGALRRKRAWVAEIVVGWNPGPRSRQPGHAVATPDHAGSPACGRLRMAGVTPCAAPGLTPSITPWTRACDPAPARRHPADPTPRRKRSPALATGRAPRTESSSAAPGGRRRSAGRAGSLCQDAHLQGHAGRSSGTSMAKASGHGGVILMAANTRSTPTSLIARRSSTAPARRVRRSRPGTTSEAGSTA